MWWEEDVNYIEWDIWYYCKFAKYKDQPKSPSSCYKMSYEHRDLQNIAFFSFVKKKVTITSFSMLLSKCQFVFTVYIHIFITAIIITIIASDKVIDNCHKIKNELNYYQLWLFSPSFVQKFWNVIFVMNTIPKWGHKLRWSFVRWIK